MMTHMTNDRRHFHCIRFCWKFNVNRDYRESILWKDRIRLLYNVILVDLDEDDILGSVWRFCLHSGTGFGLPDDIDVRILLQECVLQVLGFHLGGFPERGLGPDQLGLQLPREQVGRRRAGAGRGGHGNGDFSFGFHGDILDILITFWNMRQMYRVYKILTYLCLSTWSVWSFLDVPSDWTLSHISWLSLRNL